MSVNYEMMNTSGPYGAAPAMATAMDDYAYASATMMSRHAPESALDQPLGMTQDSFMSDYLIGNFDSCNLGAASTMNNYTNGNMFVGPPSPPEEAEIALQLQAYGRHATMAQDTIGCEPLGLSKLQPYRLDLTIEPRIHQTDMTSL